MNQPMWTADRRIFLDANGNAVEDKDPTRVSLLVAPGHKIPMSQAIELGLVTLPTKAIIQPEVKAVAPVSNKAVKPASNKAKK